MVGLKHSQPARQTDKRIDAHTCTNSRILTCTHTDIYIGTLMYTHKTAYNGFPYESELKISICFAVTVFA